MHLYATNQLNFKIMKKVLVTFMVALFATVVLGQATKTEIRPTDLPDCVTKYIHQNMVGYTIVKVYRIENKLVITYDVTVMKGKGTLILTWDSNCKLLKKVNPDEKKNPDNGNVKKKPEPKPAPTNPATEPEKPAPPKK